MLGSSPLMAFVATRDTERARAFYRDVLGLKLIADEPSALVFDADGSMLRLAKVPSFTPAPYTVLGWRVENILAAMADLTREGVPFERFEGLTQDESGVCTFPEGTMIAWFKDPDGNILSLTQFV
jgi:catechol 2,3-dioxygenase-like lactoylglutathione lyase family enzyme